MSALSALGLEPAPEEEAAPTETVEPTQAPAPSAAESEASEEVVVPEGADNPDAVKSAIQAERRNAREANARARDLERQLAARDEAEKPLEERISAADKKATEAEAKALKLGVALSKGISLTLASRLQGSTQEELEADADALLAEVGSRGPGMDGGFKPAPAETKTPEAAHNAFITGLLQNTRHGQQQ